MKRTYSINKEKVDVEYELQNNTWKVINKLPSQYEFMGDVDPQEFQFIGDTHKYDKIEVTLVSEEDGIIMTERIEKTFELEFIKDGEVISTIKEFVRIPSLDTADTTEFWKITESNQLEETYNYGEEENLAHEYYWEADDLQEQYTFMGKGESKTYTNYGDLPDLKLTCTNSANLYLHEDSLIS